MRAVALMLSITLLGCFNNPQHRTFAKLGEGALIVGGIAMLAVVNTGADCKPEGGIGSMPDEDCESRASLLSSIGLGMILVGMVGFIVTVSTSSDDDATTAPVSTPKPAADGGAKPADPAPQPAPAQPAPTPDPAAPAPASP